MTDHHAMLARNADRAMAPGAVRPLMRPVEHHALRMSRVSPVPVAQRCRILANVRKVTSATNTIAAATPATKATPRDRHHASARITTCQDGNIMTALLPAALACAPTADAGRA